MSVEHHSFCIIMLARHTGSLTEGNHKIKIKKQIVSENFTAVRCDYTHRFQFEIIKK